MRRLGAVLACVTLAGAARADAPPPTVVDRTAVRFVAPETGGAEHPRFIFERLLSFEARLETLVQSVGGVGDGYGERDVRTALEHDVASQMLANLAQKLIADSPAAQRPAPKEVDAAVERVTAAFVERCGGRARVDAAAAAEHVEPYEVDGLLRRTALAAWYVDRALTPILHPTDEQLRELYRQPQNPFHGRPFADVKDALARWFLVDRVLVSESAFLQAARSHVKIVVTP